VSKSRKCRVCATRRILYSAVLDVSEVTSSEPCLNCYLWQYKALSNKTVSNIRKMASKKLSKCERCGGSGCLPPAYPRLRTVKCTACNSEEVKP